jgi:hypothetical protein
VSDVGLGYTHLRRLEFVTVRKRFKVLPDFPDLKKTVLDQAYATMHRILLEKHPVLASIKSYVQHEGRSMRYEQIGYGEKQEDLTSASFPIEITFDEVPNLIGDKLTEKMEKLADAVGEHQMATLLTKHNEATEMTGNRIDARGHPMDGGLLLQMMETMPIDFDSAGNILPTTTLLTHPAMTPSYEAAIKEIENDPELQSRHRADINRQYNDWLDRENSRKLVD